jgi:hypothetical protein
MVWRAAGVAGVVAAAACTSIAGLDGEYVLGESTAMSVGNGGASSAAATGGASSMSSSAAAGGSAGQTGGSGGGVACVEGEEHLATIADCIAIDSPNPDECAAVLAPGVMLIDLVNGALGDQEVRSYLRFDLASIPPDAVSLELQLVVGDASDAPSMSSGEVWQVEKFVRDDLFQQPPASVGMALAGDQGTVMPAATVSWTLPPSAVDAAGSLFIELRTLIDDGVQYHKLDGPVPPRLIVHCP